MPTPVRILKSICSAMCKFNSGKTIANKVPNNIDNIILTALKFNFKSFAVKINMKKSIIQLSIKTYSITISTTKLYL